MSSILTRLKITLGKANADEEGLLGLRSNATVSVDEGKDIVFTPRNVTPDTGVILYPGGRCDPRAYAPVMRSIAAVGYLVAIPNMPLRMAVLDADRASKIIEAHSGIRTWVLGGHSMGGAMAAAYAFKHPDAIQGLFLMGSYAARMHAIPDRSLPVMMISGSHDFITRQSEVAAAPGRLPAHTRFVTIEGGDHYQFGNFANAELTAEINRSEQQQQAVTALLDFLKSLN
jgi:pimeloyl-ACP methyl ester carboxylesterase